MEEVKKVPDEETGGGRQNTMKILDKREEAWEEKKKSDGWNGYHVLFTETTQFLIIWEDMKKKLKIAYFATLAFLILFVVCLGGAGIWNFIESALLSAVVPIIYGMVMDYLFEDSTYYSWYYDDTTGNVIMEGTYTTFDYTMGMADEPTACDVKLTFTVDNDGNWFVSDYSGDEFDTADEFLQVAYDFYYEGNRLL